MEPGRGEPQAQARVVLRRAAVPYVLAFARREAFGEEQVLAAVDLRPVRKRELRRPAGRVEQRVLRNHAERVDQRMIGVATRALGVAFRRQSGRDAQHLAVERRVVAVRGLGAETDATDVLGQADAPQIDVAVSYTHLTLPT